MNSFLCLTAIFLHDSILLFPLAFQQLAILWLVLVSCLKLKLSDNIDQTEESLQLFPLELLALLLPDELKSLDGKVTAIRQQLKTACRSLLTVPTAEIVAGLQISTKIPTLRI